MYTLLSCDNWGNPVIQCKLCTCVYVIIDAYNYIYMYMYNNIHVYNNYNIHHVQYMYYKIFGRKKKDCTMYMYIQLKMTCPIDTFMIISSWDHHCMQNNLIFDLMIDLQGKYVIDILHVHVPLKIW